MTNSIFNFIKQGGVLCLLLCLGACSSSVPEAPLAERFVVELQAGDDINQNEQGQANPLSVTLFQLKQTDAFVNSDYFALVETPSSELKAQSSKAGSYILKPGERQRIILTVREGVNYIGVVSGYRNISHSTWRTVFPLPKKPPKKWYSFFWSDNKTTLSSVTVYMDRQATTIRKGTIESENK
ncbi:MULTISPECIES: type VI secretion system lipoprotein TssJ [Rosenbergiella]|uniref:type VI secretion system lipoprotein TssJ n=1 Tax=Rosenbergiella TaxID=1356488 RepID=UPI001F4D656E